jgi:phosphoglycerate dehydrogenase-like enzyme
MERSYMSKPVLLSLVNFTEDQLQKLRAVSPQIEVQQMSDASFEDLPEELRQRVEIMYGWGRHFGEAHRLPRLKWIQTHSAGVDYLFNQPVWQREVILTSMNGIHAVPMAEHALAMILTFRWRLRVMLSFQARSEWPHGRWDLFAAPELRGSTLGLVGYGAIARELARQAQALGMRVLAANRSGQRRPFAGYRESGVGDPQTLIPDKIYPTGQLLDMLPQCDYVAVLAPLTPDTRHLIGTEALAAMKSTAIFINLARGELVDEAALIEALQQEQIAGAGLDVFATEPLPVDSPLWQIDVARVIISPHVAGFTPNYDERASDLFAKNLRHYLAGEPLLNLVDKERGY